MLKLLYRIYLNSCANLQKCISTVKLFVVILLFWFMLSDIWSATFSMYAILSALLTILILRSMHLMFDIRITKVGLLYIFYLAKDIALSGLLLAKLIWSKDCNCTPALDSITFEDLDNSITTTLHANAITMTPGTFVIYVEGDCMLVHVINKSLIELLPNVAMVKLINQ